MNCVELFFRQSQANPTKAALWLPDSGEMTFEQLVTLSERAQKLLIDSGIKTGDSILMVDFLSPRMYATIVAALGLGASVLLVEPWMPVSRIEQVVRTAKPKLFLANWFGRLWGSRVKAIRDIGKWVSASKVNTYEKVNQFVVEQVDPELFGIITFTTGTTGNPKGVIRNQGFLVAQHEVLSKNLELEAHSGPDLTIFANFALANLASGRGSVIIPAKWKPKHLRMIDDLPKDLRPETMTCGPAFLLKLMEHTQAKSLKSIHVGGALTDCWIFEKGFERWPEVHWTHIYGSTEAEPVAVMDAREAVQKSRDAGYFQTLCLGRPVDEITSDLSSTGAWITGPHVCPRYLGNEEENRLNKRKDEQGRVWHFMGDRISLDSESGTWWYQGRSNQEQTEFQKEQEIYSKLQSSMSFLHRKSSGDLVLLGKNVEGYEDPEISQTVGLKIYRDNRHRARLDRKKSIRKGAKWLLG